MSESAQHSTHAACDRREALRRSAAVACGLIGAGLLPAIAGAQPRWNAAAFDAATIDRVLAALGASAPLLSSNVVLTAPDVADNGGAVPMSLSTELLGVERLALLIENNPTVLVAVFDVTDAVDAHMSLRVKMLESSKVIAVAFMSDGRVLYSTKDVKVTLGGCAE
jgi:sulfur-oxidizing protein SoxY